MKPGWEKKRIGDIATIKPPKSEARKRVGADEFVSFLPMEDLGIAVKHPEPKQTKRLSDVVGSYTYFAEGDVLLAKITPCFENGKLGIAKGLKNGIGFGSSEFIVIRPGSTMSNEWLFYFLSRDDFRNVGAQRMGGAVGHQRVPKQFVEDYEIPIPPLPEQRRIVAMLDQAFAGLAVALGNAEKNLKNARALFASQLNEVFSKRGDGWVERPLKELSQINYGYTESATTESVGPKFLRITDIQYNSVDWDSVPYCQIEVDILSKYQLADGDIVFSRTGATTGKSYLVKKPPKAVFASYLIRLRLNETNLISDFVNLFFQSFIYWTRIRSGISGSAQGGFNAAKLGEIAIPYPQSINEQQNIVAQLDALSAETRRLESIYRHKLNELAALKKSLLHQAFAGEL